MRLADASAIFVSYPVRLPKSDLTWPQTTCSNWSPRTGSIVHTALAVEAVAVRARAAIIAQSVRRVVFARSRRRLAIVGVAASPANRQALQQPALAGLVIPFAAAGSLELARTASNIAGSTRREREFSIHSSLGAATREVGRGDGFRCPRMGRRRGRAPESGLAEGLARPHRLGYPHAADRGSIPIGRTPPGPTAHLMQAPAHFAQAQPIQADHAKTSRTMCASSSPHRSAPPRRPERGSHSDSRRERPSAR